MATAFQSGGYGRRDVWSRSALECGGMAAAFQRGGKAAARRSLAAAYQSGG